MEPRKLTEEMPETPEDLQERDLHLDEGKICGPKSQPLTEDLPQEEEEEPKTLTEG